MKLLFVRHAIAVERGTPGIPDDERRLTKRGVRRFRKVARGIARLVEAPSSLLTSPLPRARETADILAGAWGGIKVVPTPALVRGSLHDLAAAIGKAEKDRCVVLVGHEPHVSAWLAEILGKAAPERLTFRKGGCALVECAGEIAEGGRLLFFVPPRVLRQI